MSDTPHNVFPINIEDIMHTAYLQYSLSVNVGRAIPDVRDGMKPCNRRILYAMGQRGLTKSHKTVKCAKVVGDVLGSYHPHGDASVYDTLVRMAQDFSMRTPLIEGQGNFGSIDGDPPAAYRYTECRMERIAEELLADIEKETVNMVPTFDEETKEPEVLPAKFPNVLVNGSVGIGVGMATNIPTHNLGEVVNATIHLLENPTATVRDLMQHLPGPDFPTGGIICGINPVRALYETGHAVLKIRAKTKIVEKGDREQIIVTEIPYALNKELLVKKIADVVKEKRITGISGLRDESNKKIGIRIVIDIKRGAMASVVLNQLFATTQLESAFGCNMLVVDHNRPRVMNLVQILQAFIDHRFEVVTRRAEFELRKARERAHILAGLLIAVRNIDEVVKIIRESRDRESAGKALMARFDLDAIQAAAILNMRLHQLTNLAVDDLENQYNELMARIAELEELLASREKRLELIKTELAAIRDKYADPRRTEITYDDGDIDIADLIPRHSCIITVSDTGYIKRVPADTYRTQHRGGSGVIGMSTKEEDHVARLFSADSHDIIFFITNRGFMYWLNVYDIPEGARTGNGKAIVNLIKFEKDEQISAMVTVNRAMFEQPGMSLVMCTRNGIIKKTPLSAFKNLRKVALRALVIEENDNLIAADLADGSSEIILSTAKGMACRFSESKVRPMGRAARGVHGLKFKIEGDYVVSMEVVATGLPPVIEAPAGDLDVDADNEENVAPISDADVDADAAEEAAAIDGAEAAAAEETAEESAEGADEAIPEDASKPQLLVVTSRGMGKRSYVDSYRLTGRGAMGVRNIKLGEGETVVAAIKVHPGEDIILTTQRGQVVRTRVDEIRLVGRNSMGVRIIALRKNDSIIGVSTVMQVEEEEPKEPAENTGVFAAAGEPLPVREDAETEAEEVVEEIGGDDDFDDDAPKKQSEEEDDDYVDPTDFGGGDDGGNVPF